MSCVRLFAPSSHISKHLQVEPSALPPPDSLGSRVLPLDHHALVSYTPSEQDKVVSDRFRCG